MGPRLPPVSRTLPVSRRERRARMLFAPPRATSLRASTSSSVSALAAETCKQRSVPISHGLWSRDPPKGAQSSSALYRSLYRTFDQRRNRGDVLLPPPRDNT